MTDVKIISVEMDEFQAIAIITECIDETHEWLMQTCEGKFSTMMGCLEFLNGEEFDKDDFSDIENAHYEAANCAFNANAMEMYDATEQSKLDDASIYHYAEFDSCETVNDPRGFGQEIQIGSIDLWRFDFEEERDDFVEKRQHASAVSAEYALENHKDQFKYWEQHS